MIEFIEKAVARHSSLSVKENKGEHYRVMKAGWDGSLWIHKTERRGYRLETTGSTGTVLNSQIESLLRRKNDHTTVKGYKVWYVETASETERIISLLAQL